MLPLTVYSVAMTLRISSIYYASHQRNSGHATRSFLCLDSLHSYTCIMTFDMCYLTTTPFAPSFMMWALGLDVSHVPFMAAHMHISLVNILCMITIMASLLLL